MWYEGVAEDGTRSIGVAVSQDGITGWKRRDGCAPQYIQCMAACMIEFQKSLCIRPSLGLAVGIALQSNIART